MFLVLFDSSVSILSRRLNLFLVSAVWFGRVDTFSHSRSVDDGAGSILDCGERSRLSQFSSRFGLSNLDEGGRIGNLWELSLAGDFLFGEVVYVWAAGFVYLLVGWWFYFGCFTGFFFICSDWSWLGLKFSQVQFFSRPWNFGQSFSSTWINFSMRVLCLLSWLIVSALRATEA